jgi:hypothetical protein
MKDASKQANQISHFLLFLALMAFPALSFAQNLREMHNEIPDDPYVPVDLSTMERGPAYQVRNSTYFTTQVNVDVNGNDIIGDAANETSIAVDPTNPNRIVIGWRQFDTVTNNFRQAGNAYSLDGGLTWTFPGVLNPGVFRSDPVLDFDADGNFYYNSLRGTFACDVYKITDGGTDWGAPFPAYGGDKQWMRLDKTTGIGAGNNYSYWNESFSTCSPGNFTRSIDGSNTFEACELVDGSPIWGTLAVDADGTLYVVGAGGSGLILIKSTTAKDPSISPVTFDSVSSVDLDGQLSGFVPINPQGLLGQAWVDVDISGGPGHGNVYVLASVDRDSNSDPGDVMFARSTDGGATFEPPQRINTDVGTSAYQWFGTMSVAPNGRIDVAWLDTRNAPTGTDFSRLYFSYSEDQGSTWSANEPISIAFDPHIGYPNQNKMGDYFDMVSDNDGAHLAWANTINGGQDAYYTHITPALLGLNDVASEGISELKSYPNPFSNETTIEFFSKNDTKVTLEVFNLLGNKVNTLLDESIIGKNRIIWDGTSEAGAKLQAGIYFIRLQTEAGVRISKVLLQ